MMDAPVEAVDDQAQPLVEFVGDPLVAKPKGVPPALPGDTRSHRWRLQRKLTVS